MKAWDRRQFLYGYVRERFLFALSTFLRSTILPYHAGIQLGERVRVQRVGSLKAECPNAKIAVGKESTIYEHARLEAFGSGNITIGEQCILGDIRVVSRQGVTFGDRVITSWNVFIQDFDPHPLDPKLRREQVQQMADRAAGRVPKPSEELLGWDFPSEPVTIGDDVWIGANVTILKGARIGSGSIVAAGAIVTAGDYPPNSIIAGNPAKVLREVS